MIRVRTNERDFRGVAIGGLMALLACAGACGDDSGSGGKGGTTGSSGRGGSSSGGRGGGTAGTSAGGSGGGTAGTSAGGSGGGTAGTVGGAGAGGRGGAAGAGGAAGTVGGAGAGGRGGGAAGASGGAGTAGTGGAGGAAGTVGAAGADGAAGTGGVGGAAGTVGGAGAGGAAGGVAGTTGTAGIGGAAGGAAGTGDTAGTTGAGGTAGGAGAGGTGGDNTFTEVEPNNASATANVIGGTTLNVRVGAAISPANDNDFFSFTVAAGTDALYITTYSGGVDTTCASANTTLTLIGSDGTTQLASNTNISPTQLCSHISYAPTPGTYYVRVTPNSASATFNYVLAVRGESLPAATAETEPNEDGTPSTGNGTSTFEGNDFSAANGNGPFSADTVITAALTPAGDEDVFAIRNPGTAPVEVYLETFNGGFAACTGSVDTQIRIRDASGTVLAFNDDASMSRTCSFLPYIIPAGATVYAHVIDFGDNTAAAAYSLHVSFP
jgi:hypothetical protein